MRKLLQNPKAIRAVALIASAFILLNLAGCSSANNLAKDVATPKVEYFADNGTGNPVAVVQHPAGEYHKGITYVSYQGPFEDPYVAAYNHETKEWLGPFRAGTSELGRLKDRTKFDNHGKPTLLIDDAGYIHIFYGGHGGSPHHGVNPLGNVHHGANKHSISKRPLDISEWEAIDNISVFGTYNQALKMANGDIYLFYRHGAHRSDWVFQKSTDNGRTFEKPVSFLKHKRRTDLAAEDSWYPWVGHGKGDDLIVTFDYHLCWDANATARGHVPERHDTYYMTFNTKTGIWKNVQGEILSMPLEREQADQKALVLDTADSWTFNGSTYLDDKGFPHITTNIGKDIGELTGGPKVNHHIHWDGSTWQVSPPINGGRSAPTSADFIVKSSQEVDFIVADRDQQQGVVGWWHTKDGGKSFTKGKELLRRDNAGFANTSMIKNAHPDARIIVAEQSTTTPHHKIYLIGDNGPVMRDVKSATLEKDQSVFKQN